MYAADVSTGPLDVDVNNVSLGVNILLYIQQQVVSLIVLT
jgi:hypothetical protein